MKKYNQEEYKLVGTMNIYGLIPGFTEPIFERDGKYYFQERTNGRTINYFEEIENEEFIETIHFFTEEDQLKCNDSQYHIGDKAVAAFQINDSQNFISEHQEFYQFLKYEITKIPNIENNKNLLNDIKDFLNEVFPHKKKKIMSQINKKPQRKG